MTHKKESMWAKVHEDESERRAASIAGLLVLLIGLFIYFFLFYLSIYQVIN